MNRPPLWSEAIEIDWGEDQSLNGNIDNISCMQEALTCEWLIEQGLMPDPTETNDSSITMFLMRNECFFADSQLGFQIFGEKLWFCEDKTK